MASRIELELLALSEDQFEQLVFALVVAEHPDVDWRRVTLVRAPDGGVDVMLIGERHGRKIGWQAKHVREPHWVDWENSLDTARESHEVDELTFVFPFNPTEQQGRAFAERLRQRHADVAVEHWTLAHLEDLCRKHQLVYERYLGADDKLALLERLDRTIRAGGKIEHGADLLERLQAISEQLDAKDPHFAVRIDAGAAGTPSPEWSVPPYIKLAFIVDGREAVVAFWTREESPVDRPYFGFTDDDAGRAARARARTELAAGRAVTLREGVWLGITSPLILRELSEQGIVLPGFGTGRVKIPAPLEGGLRIEPGDAVDLTVIADQAGAALERTFTGRPVLAEEPAKGEVVASVDGIQLSLRFFPRDEGGVDFALSFGWRLAPAEAQTLIDAAEWLLAVIDGGASLVLGEEPLEEKGPAPDAEADRLRRTLEGTLAFLRDLRLIEERTGISLPLPPQEALTALDLAAVAASAEIFRAGRGTATFQRGTQRVPVTEITQIADRRSGSEQVRDVQYEIFGKTVTLGRGRYTLPKLKLADVQALGDDPFSPARVWLEAEHSDQMEFVLDSRGG
jgi:hypothetical protein